MKNTFKFSYLTPTPDTLANIALCRWNDALKGLPAFIQIYMQSQHFLQGFGFSRALSYKEYLNKKITKDTDLKVYVGGYEINLSELLVDHDLDLVKISNGASNLVTFFRITCFLLKYIIIFDQNCPSVISCISFVFTSLSA